MQKVLGRCAIVCGLVGIISVAAIATEVQDMDLESILDMKITVASKKAETISEAPGIVSVITAEDIARMPHTTLYDILAAIPGVSITESFFGYTDVSFRGEKETNYNNRTLLLLNGHPIHDVTVNTYWLEAIPPNVIDRIEIIRGPGSVLYGTGAFAGVINVITKSKINIGDATVKGGTQGLMEGRVTFGRTNDKVNYIGGASYHYVNGYNAQVKDEAGNTQQMGYYPANTKNYHNNFYNVFANVGMGGFALDVYDFNQKKDKFGLTPNHFGTGEAETQVSGASIRFAKELGKVEINAQGFYDQSSYKALLLHYPPSAGGDATNQKYSGTKYGLDTDGRFPLTDALSAFIGAQYLYQQSDPYLWTIIATGATSSGQTFPDSHNTNDMSEFAQLEIAPISILKINAGVRFNNNKDYGNTSVPRASAVLKAADKLFIKALYGSAYRNPTFFEKYVNTPGVLLGGNLPGNTPLKPEKETTSELGLDWIVKNIGVRLSLFNLVTEDTIGRTTVGTPTYINFAKGQEINGAEFEVRGEVVGKLLGYNLNFSYKDGKDKVTDAAIPYLDKFVANAILSNTVSKFKNDIVINYVGERNGTNLGNAATSLLTGLTVGQTITVPAMTLVNLKSTYSISDRWDVALTVMNIFEQTVLYPEYIRSKILGVPGDSQREVYGEVTYKF